MVGTDLHPQGALPGYRVGMVGYRRRSGYQNGFRGDAGGAGGETAMPRLVPFHLFGTNRGTEMVVTQRAHSANGK